MRDLIDAHNNIRIANSQSGAAMGSFSLTVTPASEHSVPYRIRPHSHLPYRGTWQDEDAIESEER